MKFESKRLGHQFIHVQANGLYTPILRFIPSCSKSDFSSIYNLKGIGVRSDAQDRVPSGCISRLDGSGLVEGGANGTELDVGEDNAGAGRVGLDVGGGTGGGGAGTTGNTGLRWVGSRGVAGVEPEL